MNITKMNKHSDVATFVHALVHTEHVNNDETQQIKFHRPYLHNLLLSMHTLVKALLA